MKTKLILLFLGIFCSLGALAQVSSITDGGYYYIRLKSNTDYCAQIPSTAGGAVIKSNKQWSIIKLKKTAEGYYTIQDANSGMFANLSAAGDVESTTANDVRIISSRSAYSWYFEYNSEGGYWQIKATSESVRFWDSWNSASYPSSIPIALLSNNNNNKWQIVEVPFPEKEIAHKTAKAWPYVIQGFEGLATSTSQFSSNSVITWEGGGFDALLDNDVSTYCMTDWYYATSGDPYYIVTIAEPIKEFYLSYTTPPNANNTPITWVLEGYNENSDTWVEQTVDFGDIPSEANKVYISDKITLNNSYSKLRFTVTANQGNGKKGDGYTYFGLSEMYLFPVNDHVDAAVARLKELPAAIDLTNEDISEINDIDQSIRNAKLALWKDEFMNSAGANASENFDKIGWPTTAAYTTFRNTINNLTIEDDYETVGAAALTTLWDAIIYPPTGYYYIHNLGTGRYAFSDETISSNQDFTNDEARSSKYIWKVTLDGTNVKVYSLTGHGITLNNNGGEQKGNLALETPDANSYITARGAFYMGCIQDPNQNSFTYTETSYISASNPMKLTYYNGDRNNSKAYWLFEPVNESTYDVYTVNMVNSPADNYVIYTGSSTTGNKKVYDGGQYFMTKDASVVAGEFTPEDVAGYEVDVSISSKTIIVTYTVTDYEALITAYFDTDKQRNLANAGKIGYMQNTGANFASLSELVASFANPSHVYTADDYNNLIIYYEACAANPILPEVGKYYLIKNKVNGKYMHVTASGKRGTVLADLTAEEAAKDVSAHFYLTENASKYYMTTQGEYLNWVYYNYDGYEGYTSINLDKYARFFVPTPGYIAFSIAYDNGSQQAYIDAGCYSIKSDISTIVSGSPSGGASNDLAQWTFEEVTSVTIAMNTVEDKSYATFSAPFDVTIGEGAKVYTVKLNGNYAVCSEIADKKIPKGEGVLLISDEGVSSVVATINSGEDFANLNNNDLIGYYFATTFSYPNTTSNWNLVLGNSATKGIGFYKMNGTATANKAYLPYPHVEGSSVKGFVLMFDDDDATGIGGLTPNPSCDGGVVYNLSGQRLSRMQKGINIVNGKKVLIK